MSRRLRPMVNLIASTSLAAVVVGGPGITSAAIMAIDDSGTVVFTPFVPMRWRTSSPRASDGTLMTGSTEVRVRLDVTRWLRRPGRIYLVLPAQQPGTIRASWTTGGRLLPGQVTAGNRTLVYAGPIRTPFVEDVLQLAIVVDGRQLRLAYDLSFRFEMDTTSP